MTFARGAVKEIPTDAENVHAFRVAGHLDAEAMEALAEYMNTVFDRSNREDEVHMLFDLSEYTGSDNSALFRSEVVKSRWRSLGNVGKYAVIGAPDVAARMIELFDFLIPVDARTFSAGEREAAWTFVGTRPLQG